jgi:hypothetical protein
MIGLSLLTLVGAAPALAESCKPVNGRIVSQAVPIGQPLSDGSPCAAPAGLFCTSGRFTGGLSGTFDFTPATVDMSGNPDFASTGIAFFTGELILQTKHGGLRFRDAGALDVAIAVDGGSFASVLTIVEGTGSLTGATGRVRDEGIFIGGCVDCRYRGEVCFLGNADNDTGDESDD